MLAANEFTVGTLAEAVPLSLILPRNEREIPILVGHIGNVPNAVVLSGDHVFHCFESSRNEYFAGLIVPDVRIELNENSLFDADFGAGPLGSVIRLDAQLAILAKGDVHSNRSALVTLHDGLKMAQRQRVGFHRWQIVIGEGADKRALWSTPVEAEKAPD